MKKQGFTLSEVIVALAIVAVVAVITAPILGGIIPDKNKVAVLKVYKTISEINSELLNNPMIYRKGSCEDPNQPGVMLDCEGLNFDLQPMANPYDDARYSGNSKYPLLLASKLDTVEDVNGNTLPINFTTSDGIVWSIDGGAGTYIIDIDLNGDNGPNCSECRNADQYSFNIDNNGRITCDDALSQAYITNPYKLNDKKADYAAARID